MNKKIAQGLPDLLEEIGTGIYLLFIKYIISFNIFNSIISLQFIIIYNYIILIINKYL